MNRFERVIEILDAAVGGDSAPVGFHGAFWRGVSRNDFVTMKVFGLELISVGNGTQSNLVKALMGEPPFGADTGNEDSLFNRMPSGLRAVPAEEIEFIETWIDEGALEDDCTDVAPLTWRRTGAPSARRHDDVWFLDPLIGWAVNSDGNIIKTADGGDTWVVQQSTPGVYLRCVGFANANRGWVGTLTRSRRLYETTDGGANWTVVSPLPTAAPVAVCGLSVVSDQVIFASGTNRPNDAPRMMKTLDGGTTWTAWDMSAHANILIDTYFVDSQHGWVVGGKGSEPTPTTRDTLKPVVLETTDGGATWTNRLAGQEDEFPFGEWGWKIQFLDDQVGFVSLENFTAGAILKTLDGGKTWTRLKINDPQGNVNLEGIGFIDKDNGWVGGWGSADFMKGFTSATSDGGNNWVDANEVGLFINRFRFFGNPVNLGYASGDAIYKYSSDPAPAGAESLVPSIDAGRTMLPDTQITGTTESVIIRMNVPEGTKRLTLNVWDWYGVEIGCVLDEIHPAAGARVFEWDGLDPRGQSCLPGPHLIRMTADDMPVSSFLHVRPGRRSEVTAQRASVPRRSPYADARAPRFTTLAALMAAPIHDLAWLRNALQIAMQLELSTLPPYLTARWTVTDLTEPVAQSINEIRGEEMLHFGLVCNLTVAIGSTPLIASESVVPKYPGPLPGGVRPELKVGIRKLDQDQAKVFMDIEYPQGGPVGLVETFDSIGEFYEAILAAFKDLNPPLSTDRQISISLPSIGQLMVIDTPNKVEMAIQLINLQGEGSNKSPEEAPGDLAHHYRFGEIHHGKRFVQDAQGNWGYTGPDFPLPDIHNMADIPEGGYQRADVPDVAIWDLITRFDKHYSDMLRQLELTWTHGNISAFWAAVGEMGQMHSVGRELITKPRPDGQGNYGPSFRFVP